MAVIADYYKGEEPIMFLDIDNTIARENGGPIDREALDLVTTCCRQTEAKIVLCTDRVRDVGLCHAELFKAGLPRGLLVGHCSTNPYIDEPMPSLEGQSSKVLRLVEWLELADARCSAPQAWCVVDDARTLSMHWMTAPAHVMPSGPVITRLDMSLAWALLLRKMPHSIRRSQA